MGSFVYTFFFLLTIHINFKAAPASKVLLPVKTAERHKTTDLRLTEIGEFGIVRNARPGIPAHLHTGIDIKRPNHNYHEEPVFSIAPGVVVSKRADGAYAQLIIEHHMNNERIWTVYEHIAGIKVNTGDKVDPFRPVARFMNIEELNKHGWQFDHFHFEILRQKPVALKTDPSLPERHFASYTLACHTKTDLQKYFLNPHEFFRRAL